MTRRGSFVYYLVAVVAGCFFLVVGIVAIGEGSFRWSQAGLRDFFLTYFLALAYGSFSLLLFAFLLRRIVGMLKWNQSWQWMAAGAVLAPSLVWLLYLVWSGLLASRVFAGPQVIWWMIFGAAIGVAGFAASQLAATVCASAVGGATAFLLCRIQRAFEPPGKPPGE